MTHNFACEKRRTRITRTHARERKRKGACANFRVATTRRNLDQNIPIWVLKYLEIAQVWRRVHVFWQCFRWNVQKFPQLKYFYVHAHYVSVNPVIHINKIKLRQRLFFFLQKDLQFWSQFILQVDRFLTDLKSIKMTSCDIIFNHTSYKMCSWV